MGDGERKRTVREKLETGVVDDAEVDDELRDLQGGDMLFPPEPTTPRGPIIIVIYVKVVSGEGSNREAHEGRKADIHMTTCTKRLSVMTVQD